MGKGRGRETAERQLQHPTHGTMVAGAMDVTWYGEIRREGTDTDLEIRREVDGFTTSVTELTTLADGLEATHERNGGV